MISFVIDDRAERNSAFAEITRRYAEFWKQAPPDLQAAFLAGCEIEYDSQIAERGMTITARTRNPVAVRRDPNGQITVFEGKPHGPR